MSLIWHEQQETNATQLFIYNQFRRRKDRIKEFKATTEVVRYMCFREGSKFPEQTCFSFNNQLWVIITQKFSTSLVLLANKNLPCYRAHHFKHPILMTFRFLTASVHFLTLS
jgi:hypothetical protein